MLKSIPSTFKCFLLGLLVSLGNCAFAQFVDVWPGDANNNGITNHFDLLYLGLNYGLQGPGRDSVDIRWAPQNAELWQAPTFSPVNPAYSDCNGDSLVDSLDIAAIELNFGLTQGTVQPDSSSLSTSPNAYKLAFEVPLNLVAGTTIRIPINLGDTVFGVDSLLGLAATVTFNPALVDTAYISFTPSWIGTTGMDLASFQRYTNGNLAFAASRNTRNNVFQQTGQIGEIIMVLEDNLKSELTLTSLDMEFTEVLALTAAATILPVAPVNTSLDIEGFDFDARLYPNPTHGKLNVQILGSQGTQLTGRVINMMGSVQQSFTTHEPLFVLECMSETPGVYFLELTQGNSRVVKRFVVAR